MSSAVPTQPVVKYKFADRDRSFEWSYVAVYRMSCLAMKPAAPYAQLVAMLWACLVESDAADFPTPESLAKLIPPEQTMELFEKIVAVIRPPGSEPKNVAGSTPKRSRSSS